MLQCLLHFARSPIQHSQILNCALPNLQLHIVKITIFTSPLLHRKLDEFTLFYGLLKCFWTAPPTQNPWVTQLVFKVFFAQTLFFWAIFFWGQWQACSSGLPSYLLAYILTNLHAHLLRLPIHLPTYLGVGPYPHLPTI
jgi:hypothetical protein